MSSIFEPGSLLLLAAAAFIFVFIIHGLWFANRPQSRKLDKNDAADAEIEKSENIGKVRVVYNNAAARSVAAGSANHGAPRAEASISVSVSDPAQHAGEGMLRRRGAERIEPVDGADGFSYEAIGASSDARLLERYEFIVAAPQGCAFSGTDIDAVCTEYGFLPGFFRNNLKIYAVYENADRKTDEVFRICSMENPYYFPEDMSEFSTQAIALYMPLPPKGKGYAYFKALRLAADIFMHSLGGELVDSAKRPLNDERLDRLAAALQRYDEGAE